MWLQQSVFVFHVLAQQKYGYRQTPQPDCSIRKLERVMASKETAGLLWAMAAACVVHFNVAKAEWEGATVLCADHCNNRLATLFNQVTAREFFLTAEALVTRCAPNWDRDMPHARTVCCPMRTISVFKRRCTWHGVTCPGAPPGSKLMFTCCALIGGRVWVLGQHFEGLRVVLLQLMHYHVCVMRRQVSRVTCCLHPFW